MSRGILKADALQTWMSLHQVVALNALYPHLRYSIVMASTSYGASWRL